MCHLLWYVSVADWQINQTDRHRSGPYVSTCFIQTTQKNHLTDWIQDTTAPNISMQRVKTLFSKDTLHRKHHFSLTLFISNFHSIKSNLAFVSPKCFALSFSLGKSFIVNRVHWWTGRVSGQFPIPHIPLPEERRYSKHNDNMSPDPSSEGHSICLTGCTST